MPKIFISYSHKDEEWKDRLQTQLAVLEMEGLLSVWEDRQIELGDSWYPEIEKALNNADVAILLISANFLASKFIRSEEIPRLLKRREQEGIRVIPLILKPCPWSRVKWLSAMQGATRDNIELSGLSEHEQDSALSCLAEKIDDLVQKSKKLDKNSSTKITPSPKIDRLPTVKGEFFGRESELKLLNDVWLNKTTNIIQFIAPGGTGKTKLLRYWLDQVRPEKLIAWSFYSQGLSEAKQPSATLFYNRVFELLDPSKTITDFVSQPEKMGEYLADLIRQRNCLLILDGFEPLQHATPVLHGALKDRTMLTLLKSLAMHHTTLCIITTRIAIHELSGHSRPAVISYDVQDLAAQDGVELLKSLQVTGSDTSLLTAVNEYGCHALALHLLGNALTTYLDGDILKRGTLDDLIDEYDEIGQHAFKVMQAYKKWLKNTPELQLLYLLGLFDHPIEIEVLEVLWKAQIPNITENIPFKAWKIAIRDLREKHRLLSIHEGRSNLLDCHPLIREYFGSQLEKHWPEACQQAHQKLYEYYAEQPERNLPKTLEEMRPLFNAVTHGCAAGLHQQVYDKIYVSRIHRGREAYSLKQLGAFSDELALLSNFFDSTWTSPCSNLNGIYHGALLYSAGYVLRSIGRLPEALESMQAAHTSLIEQNEWFSIANVSSSISEVHLALGEIKQSIEIAWSGAKFSHLVNDSRSQIINLSILADSYINFGHQTQALNLFKLAQELHAEYDPEYDLLYSLMGFRYCKLLIDKKLYDIAIEYASLNLEYEGEDWYSILDAALDKLTLGKALLKKSYRSEEHIHDASYWINDSLVGLRDAGDSEMLVEGILVYSEFLRFVEKYQDAYHCLLEVFDITKPCGMRLHLADYHLEMARLRFAQEKGNPQPHIEAAETLIEETGYHRRDAELSELKAQLLINQQIETNSTA